MSSSVLGNYRLLDLIGEGGVGRVHRAVDPSGREVAVKILADGADLRDSSAAARFAREVKVLASVHHPNLLALLDHGIDPDLGPWMATPLVAGETLRSLEARARLCPEAALVILHSLLEGLAVMHREGLVHRDLKPENVMVTPEGQLVIVDLGLAWHAAQTRHTEAGTVAGSVPYMSPEQIEDGGISTASDVWSIGVLTYEMVAGRRPFARTRQGEEVAAILAGVFDPLERVERRASEEFGGMVAACLSREPGDRPRDADALHERVLAQIDWVDRSTLAEELRRIVANPVAYADHVAPFRVRRLIEQTDYALRAGDGFRATKLLDRALAYAPDDGAVLQRIDRAMSLASAAPAPGFGSTHASRSEPAPAVAAAPISSTQASVPTRATGSKALRWTALLGAVSVSAVVTGLALAHRSRESTNQPDVATPIARPAAAATPSVPLGFADAAATVLPAPANTEVAPAMPVAPTPIRTGPSEVVPLDPSTLRNDDPPIPFSSQIARPGEPLVPASVLGPLGPAGALASIERQMAANPADIELPIGHAMALIGNGRDREGFAELDRVEAAHPTLAVLWASRGYLALRQGRTGDAVRYFTRALELDPRDVDALRNRGIVRRHLGRTRDAYSDLVAALAVDPNDVDALADLSQIYDHAGRRADARPLLERLLRVRPDNAQIWLDLSLILQDSDPRGALAAIERARALEPNAPAVWRRLCNQLARTESHDAVVACTSAIEHGASDPGTYMDRGLAYFAAGDDRRALLDADRAIAAMPARAWYRVNRHLIRTHAGLLDGAREDLHEACRLGEQAACAQERRTP